MKDVVYEMGKQLPEVLVHNRVFLPAVLAIGPQHFSAAVQAVFFFPFRLMRHVQKFLKNSYNFSILPGSGSMLWWLYVLLKQTISFYENNRAGLFSACRFHFPGPVLL
jgi:hypothetical protein